MNSPAHTVFFLLYGVRRSCHLVEPDTQWHYYDCIFMLTNIRNEKLLPCPTVYGNGENVISLCFLRIYGWGFSHSSSICHGGKKKKSLAVVLWLKYLMQQRNPLVLVHLSHSLYMKKMILGCETLITKEFNIRT